MPSTTTKEPPGSGVGPRSGSAVGPVPPDSDGGDASLLVAIPALNEEATVAEVIARIPTRFPRLSSVQILVVDDGSSDATAEEARRAGALVVRHATTRGVGAAFHTALEVMLREGFDFLATLDADGQFDPGDLPTLIEPVVSGAADFATASRFLDPDLTPDMPRVKLWGNRMMSRLISSLAGRRFADVSCGMRCYSRRAALRLHLMGRFTYTQEVILNLAFKNVSMIEVPLRIQGQREIGESRVANNLWIYAWRTSKIFLRCHRDYRPVRFFGVLALFFAGLGLAAAGFLANHYLSTGSFTPHKWAAFASGVAFSMTIVLLALAMIGDMLNRHRIYLEEILYRQREDSAHLCAEAIAVSFCGGSQRTE